MHVVSHPIQTAKGVGHAIAHPIQTGKAAYSQAVQMSKTPQGQGQLAFNVVSSFVSGAATSAKAANLANKAAQLASKGAKATSAAMKNAVKKANRPPAVSRGLVAQAVKQTKYKTFARAMKLNWHHIWPNYLGPPPAAFAYLSATLVGLPAAYHTVIHRAIQAALPWAKAGTFSPQQIYQQLMIIYQKYPLAGFPTKTFPQPVQ